MALKKTFVRHGDILIDAYTSPPDLTKCLPKNDLVLAYGEMTGHKHEIVSGLAKLFNHPTNPFMGYIVVSETAILDHEDHGPETLPPGYYFFERQRQSVMGREFNVFD